MNAKSCVLALILSIAWTTGTLAQNPDGDAPSCVQKDYDATAQRAEQGDAAALYRLGRYYGTGICLQNDAAGARALYLRSATLNYAPAFYQLGMMSAANDKDYAAAANYFRQGAALGDRKAEFTLGVLYLFNVTGLGGDVEAFGWLSLAASRDAPYALDAKNFLANLSKRMTAENRAQGQSLFTELNQQYGAVPAFQAPL
jgi:TPR repeat protein